MKILKEKLAKIKSNNNCMDIVIENLEKLLTIGYKKKSGNTRIEQWKRKGV